MGLKNVYFYNFVNLSQSDAVACQPIYLFYSSALKLVDFYSLINILTDFR